MSPFEFFYYIGYFLKKRYTIKNQKNLPFKVISIGNITTGGTGKTPMTIAIADEAKKRGLSPIVLTRGYKGRAKGPCFVTDEWAASSSEYFGDEPVLLAERLKNVPIVKCADRYKGGMFAIEKLKNTKIRYSNNYQSANSPIIFILDDGFQHWRLHSDLNIVLIDGQNPFGNKKMLPSGPLREPLVELKRADIFVITKIRHREIEGQRKKDIINELRKFNPNAPVYLSKYKISKVRDVSGSELSIETLKDKKIYAFCAIANPESFRQMVLPLCGELSGFKLYRDHHHYTKADLLYLISQSKKHSCDFLITTEKDMVKIRELISNNILSLKNWLCLEIDCHLGSAFFERVFDSVVKSPTSALRCIL